MTTVSDGSTPSDLAKDARVGKEVDAKTGPGGKIRRDKMNPQDMSVSEDENRW